MSEYDNEKRDRYIRQTKDLLRMGVPVERALQVFWGAALFCAEAERVRGESEEMQENVTLATISELVDKLAYRHGKGHVMEFGMGCETCNALASTQNLLRTILTQEKGER